MAEIACLNCGKAFAPRDDRQRCCTKKCGIEVYGETPERRAKSGIRYRENRLKISKERKLRYASDPEYRKKVVEKRRLYRERRPDLVAAANEKNRAKPENRAKAAQKTRAWYAKHGAAQNRRREEKRQMERKDYPWRSILGGARQRAKLFGIKCDLTPEWCRDNWTGKCAVTGLPFVTGQRGGVNLFSPSIDRIKPSLGYVTGNCRFVLFSVNSLKSNGSDEQMLFVANAIVSATRADRPGTVEAALSLPG